MNHNKSINEEKGNDANRVLATDERVRMTDAEILQIDFYDLLGSWAVFYTPEEKVKYYHELTRDV